MSASPPVHAKDAELLKALAHPARLAILHTLVAGELTVGSIEAASGLGQPGLSQQLAVLRRAGLVATRRAAKQIFYRIDTTAIAELQAVLAPFAAPPGVSSDAARNDDGRLRSRTGAAMFARIG